MDILLITHRLPYPPIDGGKIASYNFIKYYQKYGHSVHVICIVPLEEKSFNLDGLKSITASLNVFYKDVRNKKISFVKNILFSTLSYNSEKYIFAHIEPFILSFISLVAMGVMPGMMPAN